MNRRDRRAAGRRYTGPDYLAALAAETPPCPDCTAEAELWTDQHGMHHMDIAHDHTCPLWQAYQRRHQ